MDEKKVLLVDSQMDMNSMIETKETLWTAVTWNIMNFPKLEQAVIYNLSESFLQYDWYLKLSKLEKSLCVIFEAADDVNQFVDFAIIGKDNRILKGERSSDDFSDGKFVTEFNIDVILDPKNGYLKNDCLVIQCKYVDMQISEDKIHVIPWDEHRERIDIVEFQNEWREMYLQSRFCDFKIIAQGNVFYAHKVILIARSQYFEKYFAEGGLDTQNEVMLPSSPYILHEVLMFMYTGELVNMNVSVLLDVFQLALDLTIRSLIRECLGIFLDEMDSDNVVCIYMRAFNLKHEILLEACQEFMESHCPENINVVELLKGKTLTELPATN